MSLLIDQIAEQRILNAMAEGSLHDLPGQGAPLVLDDDSQVPAALRVGYRILKNAGYLPPELLVRREAWQLCDLIGQCQLDSAEQQVLVSQIRRLELTMRIKGLDTRFIYRYLQSLSESNR